MSVVGSFIVPHPPMIIPDIGGGREKQIEKTISSYEKISDEIAKLKPDTIIISSPHAKAYADYFCLLDGEKLSGNFSNFNASDVSFEEDNDIELIENIEKLSRERGFPCGRVNNIACDLDHGSMIPLYFIRKKYSNFKIIVIGLSGLSLIEHYACGMLINDAVNLLDRRCVWIASGDLSHTLQEYGPYGFNSNGPVYDEKIIDICSSGNFLKLIEMEDSFLNSASECGHRSFVMMSGAFDGIDVESKFYSHEDVTGVGYGIFSFYPKEKNTKRYFLDKYLTDLEKKITKDVNDSDDYARFARTVINDYVIDGSAFYDKNSVSKELIENTGGVFVSIHKFGMLRGCIGTTSPVYDSLADEILNNAISACSSDPRFAPVTSDELKWLEISVDVLGKSEKVDSIDELDPKVYGVIVTNGNKRGVLLPDLDGVDTVEEQISIAKRKAGILDYEDVQIERFKVVRHR